MTVPFAQVDAFTDRAFAGNPAGVCLADEPLAESSMRQVARETNLPATAFVHPGGGDGTYNLRWFTATNELELCGHGTLASAHVLYESGRVAAGAAVRFITRRGPLAATLRDGWIELDFPATPAEETSAPADLVESLGVEPVFIGRSALDVLVEVNDEDVVRNLQPDFARLRNVKARGVIVTSRSASRDRDFVSRFFAPSVGIDEDAVTGSAHCCLAAHWTRRLGCRAFVAHQLSARGGVLRVALEGERVRLSGQAVTVFRGAITAKV